jgi:Pol polyprotein, beta-barrel domain
MILGSDSDPLHTLNILQALPASYEIVQQTILATITDLSKIDWVTTQNCILSEELRQGSQPNVNTIRTKSNNGKDKCNYCGGTEHWEKDCRRKTHGLSREEAQSERKQRASDRKGKVKAKEKKDMKETTPSVHAAATGDPLDLCDSTTDVASGVAIDSICFYIARANKWMIDSGCTEHIMQEITDYSTYQPLQTPCTVFLPEKKKVVSYIGSGTIVTKTWVNGSEKKIELQNVLHSLDIGGRFLSILRIGEKGISVTFEPSKVIFSKDRVQYTEGQLTGRHYWLTLSCASPSVHSAQTRTP